MNGDQYSRFMSELDSIAQKLKLFPDDLQDSVYNDWRKLLLEKGYCQPVVEDLEPPQIEAPMSAEALDELNDERNYASEIVDFYAKYNLSKCNDMQLSAFVAYYFTVVAPPENRVEAIKENHLVDFCTITGRRIPGRPAASLSNAKNLKKYLDRVGTGTYSLTKVGEHFVKHTLLKDPDS